MLDSQQSSRLHILRFPLIVGVVFIHANGGTSDVSGVDQADVITALIRNFISNGLARIAVPLFFLMSGYFFYYQLAWSKEAYLLKVRARVKSLLVPFLFWNIVTLLFFAIAQSIPSMEPYFSGKKTPIASYSGFDYLNAIVGFNRLPIAYQFWFVRDLMVLVLLVPIIHIFLRAFPLAFLASSFVAWFVGFWPFYAPSSEATLFFCVGAYAAITDKSLFAGDRYGLVFVISYLIVVALDASFIDEHFDPYLHRFGIVLGIPAAIFATNALEEIERLKLFFVWLGGTSFFVYATHEPMLAILAKISLRLVSPSSPYLILLIYLSIPIVVIVFSVIAYRILVRFAPKFTQVITGGR